MPTLHSTRLRTLPVIAFIAEEMRTIEGVCSELFTGGMFITFEGKLPALLGQLQLRVKVGNAELHCTGEVVRHVSAENAALWQMPRGFAIQFTHTSLSQREALLKAVTAELDDGMTPPPPLPHLSAAVQHLLRAHWSAGEENYYALLSIQPDAELSCARRRARECRQLLEDVRPELDPRDQALLQPAIERINQAAQTLGDPSVRAEYDAAHHNVEGVARCIAAGLTVTELETVRRRHLSQSPGAAGEALVHQLRASSFERSRRPADAVEAYEQALNEDPLNLQLHLGRSRCLNQLRGPTRREQLA